jgi:hypothetical protein
MSSRTRPLDLQERNTNRVRPGREEHDGSGHVDRSQHLGSVGQCRIRVRIHGIPERRVGGRRLEKRRTHTGAAELLEQHAVIATQPELGGGVSGVLGKGTPTGHGADVDDQAGAALQHGRKDRAADQEGSPQVDRERGVECRHGLRGDGREAEHAGRVHDDVGCAADGLHHSVERLPCGSVVGEIGDQRFTAHVSHQRPQCVSAP